MKINTPMISAACFILSFLGYVGLQFAPHVTAGMNQSLYSIMALTLGHALGSSTTSSGTTAVIHLPENTAATSSTNATTSSSPLSSQQITGG